MKKYIAFIFLVYCMTNIFCMKPHKKARLSYDSADKNYVTTGEEFIPSVYVYPKGLCIAAVNNDIQSATELLNAGANPNIIPSNFEYQPIHLAAMFDNIEVLKLLISVKALLNTICASTSPIDSGCTALSYAVLRNNIRAVKILVEAGADVNAGLPDNKPILIATKKSRIEILKYLVSLRNSSGVSLVDINTVDNNGYTAIHHAVINGNLEAVEILVEAGADSMIRGTNGLTALDLAACYNHKEIGSYLISLRL